MRRDGMAQNVRYFRKRRSMTITQILITAMILSLLPLVMLDGTFWMTALYALDCYCLWAVIQSFDYEEMTREEFRREYHA